MTSRLLVGAAALMSVGALAMAAPPAHAGTYHHIALGMGDSVNADGFGATADAQGRGYVGTSVGSTAILGNWGSGARTAFYAPESTVFRYDAPANTSIAAAVWAQRLRGLAGGDWNVIVRDGSHDLHVDVPAANGDHGYSAAASGTYLQFLLQCGGPGECYSTPGGAQLQLDTTDITLTDNYAPSPGAASGALVSGAKLVGNAGVSFTAADNGSGVYRTRIYDGAAPVGGAVVDANGGHCADLNGVRYYDRRVPCLLSATAEAALDTTALSDGNHTIKVTVEDAAGNTSLAYGPVTKLVANHPPVNTAVPAIPSADGNAQLFAAPRVGAPIAFPSGGAWTGPSLSLSLAWLRCDASGASCGQIPDASSLTYTPTADDVGHTLKLTSTATNVAGTVTVSSLRSGVVTAPKSASDLVDKPTTGGGAPAPTTTIVTLPLLAPSTTTNNSHTIIGHVVGEQAGVACPGEKATLRFQHVSGGKMKLGYGKASVAQLELTCTTTGKAIADAKLEIATKTGTRPAVAADVTTDGAGHATIRLAKGASRGITVGYRMFSDDAIARATATLKVMVNGRVAIKANHQHLHNGQAVTLRGGLRGGLVPNRGVSLAVQWKDGARWRPFAQIKTNKNGKFAYAYRFTRTSRSITYRLRVQIVSGQVDYPFVSVASKPVRVTVGR